MQKDGTSEHTQSVITPGVLGRFTFGTSFCDLTTEIDKIANESSFIGNSVVLIYIILGY